MSTNQMGLVSKSKLTAIADAIREKTDSTEDMSLDEMAAAIDDIEGGGGITPTGTKQVSITQNGTTTEDVTNYASAEITVNVPSSGITPTGTINIMENGTVDVTQYASANVNVSGGSSAKVLTKLAEYTVMEEVATISIAATAQMQSCEMLFIECVNLVHSQDWIYPVVNDSALTSNGMGYTSKNTTYSAVLALVVPRTETFSGSGVSIPAVFVNTGLSNPVQKTFSSFSSINLKQYSSASRFTSGTVNVWGYV